MSRQISLSLIWLFAWSAATAFAAEPDNKKFDPQAGYAHTKLFGLEAQGDKFVYVFDRSGSMGDDGGKPLREAKKQLLASLNDLDESSQFYLIFYNDQPRLFDLGTSQGRLIFATASNKRQAEDFISNISAGGGTDHMAALTAALRLRPDVIFLLTDGEQKDDPSKDDLKRIDRINGAGTIINVIQFADTPRPASSLIELAHENRGQHVFVDVKHYGEQHAGDAPAGGAKN
jgi:von Willebrand factor type A domain